MDGSSFDRITRRLAVTTTRRGGVAALVAGALGIAGISAADARLQIPPTCGGAGSSCTGGDQCCSGRCVMKSDGFSRCARTTSNRPDKKKKKKKKGSGGETCIGEDDDCSPYSGGPCCSGLFCTTQAYNGNPTAGTCVTCVGLNENCSYTDEGGSCCESDQTCSPMPSSGGQRCCFPSGGSGTCSNDWECCGYQKFGEMATCVSGTCTDNA